MIIKVCIHLERYSKNIGTVSLEQFNKLKDGKVCVVGCGGLGGHIIQMLGRFGVLNITAVDGDVFDVSNLNRQVFSDEQVIGERKATVVQAKMKAINSEVVINPICEALTEKNAKQIVEGHNVVVDALDNVKTRKLLANVCKQLNVPFVYGAISGWLGQACTIMPEDYPVLDIIYPNENIKGIGGNPSFSPALVASIQVSEVIKILSGSGIPLRNCLLTIDLLNNKYDIIKFERKK